MSTSVSPEVSFLSLFVADLPAAALHYEAVFGVAPSSRSEDAPAPHPFASAGPVVFRLGAVEVALYQCDMQATHPGDVGIGVVGDVDSITRRAVEQGGQVLRRPGPLGPDGRQASVFVLPGRHFFEALASTGSGGRRC